LVGEIAVLLRWAGWDFWDKRLRAARGRNGISAGEGCAAVVLEGIRDCSRLVGGGEEYAGLRLMVAVTAVTVDRFRDAARPKQEKSGRILPVCPTSGILRSCGARVSVRRVVLNQPVVDE
jgi:hypothetical protein